MDFCLAKMFVKIVAKVIFERAVMLGNFTGSPIFIKSMKLIKMWRGLEKVIVM